MCTAGGELSQAESGLTIADVAGRRLFGRKVARGAELLGLAQIDGLLSQARLRYGRGAKFLLNGSTPGLGDAPLGVDLAHDGWGGAMICLVPEAVGRQGF